ncbi:MAG: hypothetical protein J6T26_05600, partial [Firmicutes bacterium]|nr:hypothetical protein [Bacillota bacterium]
MFVYKRQQGKQKTGKIFFSDCVTKRRFAPSIYGSNENGTGGARRGQTHAGYGSGLPGAFPAG